MKINKTDRMERGTSNYGNYDVDALIGRYQKG